MSDHLEILLSDTVGFIAKLPHHLIEAFQATLEELQYADLLLHVIDASDPHREAHIEVVDRLIDKLAKPGVPVLRCYNKADLVGDVSNLPIGEKNIPMCARSGIGMDELLTRIGGAGPTARAGAGAPRGLPAGGRRGRGRLPRGAVRPPEALCKGAGGMKEYLVPTGDGEAQFIERRSRFIGHIFLTETEEEALARLKQMREQYWDATHNVYAYIIRDGATRFSDDGEPGGTAGMPVLQVLQREELYNVTCVVTRYFGGILLGAGGLVRAYAHGAKIAVDAAGRSIKRIWTNVYLPCPYSWYERIRLEVAAFGGMIRETQFGADVELDLLLPEEQTQGFLERVTDLSAGTIEGLIGKQEYRAFPLP